MAVDVCSTSEPFISPRISFSHDLNNQSSDTATTTATVATTNFDFCISLNLVQQITSADELFFDGVLLPTQIKKPENRDSEPKAIVLKNEVEKKRLKELLRDSDEEQEQEKPSVPSFWKFARSMSVNSNNGSGRGPKRLFRSLSLKRLLRTNSGLNPKGNEAIKVIKESNSCKEPTMLEGCSSSNQASSIHYYSCNVDNTCRQSVTKQNSGGGYYDGRIKINPILNIPSAYNLNLFGSGSLFCNGKSK